MSAERIKPRGSFPKGVKLVIAAWAGLLASVNVSGAQTLTPKTHQAIHHLLAFVNDSDCQFYRNGSWHTSEKAAAHIERKYQYYLEQAQIQTAEDFIKHSATKSSLSGKRYRVQCSDALEIDSATWLTQALQRYRQSTQ